MSIVVYGPQGSGKTLHAEALRAHYGMVKVVEDVYPYRLRTSKASFAADKILFITNSNPPEGWVRAGTRRAVHIEQALKEAGICATA